MRRPIATILTVGCSAAVFAGCVSTPLSPDWSASHPANPHAAQSPVPPLQPGLLSAALPLAFVGCTSTKPKAAFDDVSKTVAARTGEEVRWLREDSQSGEIERAIEGLLKTNLTAQSAIAIALLNNRTLQAEFESIGISQAELAQASRLRNPQFSGFWRLPAEGSPVVNAEFSLAQDLLDLLTLPARKKIAARNLEITKLRVAHDVQRLANEAQAAFYN